VRCERNADVGTGHTSGHSENMISSAVHSLRRHSDSYNCINTNRQKSDPTVLEIWTRSLTSDQNYKLHCYVTKFVKVGLGADVEKNVISGDQMSTETTGCT